MIEDDLRSSFSEGCCEEELTLFKCSFKGAIFAYTVRITRVLNHLVC